MTEDVFEIPKIKKYPHFDNYLPKEEIISIIRDPKRVAENAFFPFLEFTEKWTPFVDKDIDTPSKARTIRYACRRDSYIYAYYRKMLYRKYEDSLKKNDIQNCVIGYRKIPIEGKPEIGKCNIHFAKEAFDEILKQGACFAIALDISNFFDSIDHEKLLEKWRSLLQVAELPSDHKAVYKNITRYTFVIRHECYQKLGYIKMENINGKIKSTLSNKIPMQLCNPKTFREKIAPTLIYKNPENKGIPQGSPISDVLANLYLFDFDKKMSALAAKLNALYRRYSDDILLILPHKKEKIDDVIFFIKDQIAEENLEIKESKTNITEFFYQKDQLTYKPYYLKENQKSSKSGKSFEYLGFSFNGKNVLIRNKTISGYYRNMTTGAKKIIKNAIKRYPHESAEKIFTRTFPLLCKQYGKVENYLGDKSNFWSYVKRSEKVMGPIGTKIAHQLRNKNKKIEKIFIEALKKRKSNKIKPPKDDLGDKNQ